MKCLIVILIVVLIIEIIECRYSIVSKRKSQPIDTSTEDSAEKKAPKYEYHRMKALNFDFRKILQTIDNKTIYSNSKPRESPPMAHYAAFVGDYCATGKTRIKDMCIDID
ncbi:unnamed protein product [Arctia plantaginis]|uniref:Uncharacterized protein n=1 Tax=Arctia plantaginis TaxID=874455 RepID=A0A8S0Z007_ARCPL|nr:unnamed protein product [Arctia plantaginis]